MEPSFSLQKQAVDDNHSIKCLSNADIDKSVPSDKIQHAVPWSLANTQRGCSCVKVKMSAQSINPNDLHICKLLERCYVQVRYLEFQGAAGFSCVRRICPLLPASFGKVDCIKSIKECMCCNYSSPSSF